MVVLFFDKDKGGYIDYSIFEGVCQDLLRYLLTKIMEYDILTDIIM